MKTSFMATTWTCRKTNTKIEVSQINDDESLLFAVRNDFGECLSKKGEWEVEPSPSHRDNEFLERCRFVDFMDAVNTLWRAL
jgi:hypothetical protein